MTELKKPIKVKLDPNHDRDKLCLGERPWIGKNDNTPRKGIIRKNREYTVDASDYLIKHFLEGVNPTLIKQGKAKTKDNEQVEEEPATLTDKLMELPYIDEEKAQQLSSEYLDYSEFKEEVSIEDLTDLSGVGHSRAEQIKESI